MNNLFLSANNITIRVYDKFFFDNTSWQMHQGENWLILGHNGAGKSRRTSFPLTCDRAFARFKIFESNRVIFKNIPPLLQKLFSFFRQHHVFFIAQPFFSFLLLFLLIHLLFHKLRIAFHEEFPTYPFFSFKRLFLP